MAWVAGFALAAWVVVLLFPSRPWSTRERFEPAASAAETDLSRVTVLIPARNEDATIAATLEALSRQGRNLRAIVVDDRSDDATADAVRRLALQLDPAKLVVELLTGQAKPEGWGGKLWALEQGSQQVASEFCLLLDAEIVLDRGVVAGLLDKAEREQRAMVSVMATLRCQTLWERLLVPPFILFFKLLYPFTKTNANDKSTAAAAGGCILIRSEVLREVGAFAAIREALIDDCTLAARVKRAGYPIWLGLSESVRSTRAYPDLASFRGMVTRTAFTQLRYSNSLLVIVAVLMLLVFVGPWFAIVAGPGIEIRALGCAAALAMAVTYLPVISFYRLPLVWSLTLPVAGVLFLMMTVESAINYWRGTTARWKGRSYASR